MSQCTAKSKQSGERCRRTASPGQGVCASHGSKAPAARAAGQRRVEQQKVEQWLIANVKDARPLTSLQQVYDELLAVAGQAAAFRKILAERVAALTDLGYQGVTGEQVRADVLLFERAMDRSLKAGELIVRLNLDEKKQALDARQGDLVADVLRSVLDRLNLDDAQKVLVGTVVPEELRLLVTTKEPA